MKEGDDVSKKFATKEREIVHTKKLDNETKICNQDLDEGYYYSSIQEFRQHDEDPVGLEFKKPLPDEGTKRKSQMNLKLQKASLLQEPMVLMIMHIDIDEVGGTKY